MDVVSFDEERARYLIQFESLSRELAVPLLVDRAAEIERKLSMLEDIARRSGLFQPEETLEIRLNRFIARWRLGEALAPMERMGGPGRGKKRFRQPGFFSALNRKASHCVGRGAASSARRLSALSRTGQVLQLGAQGRRPADLR
jgi:hypothetical protein